jgi:tetratricopeptide (TPR) repeat protein
MLLSAVAKLTKTPSLAIPYYERALQLYPQHAITYAQYGQYLVDIGFIEAGITRLKKAIELNPNLALAYAWLAQAYSKTGNLDLARQAAERARTLGFKGKMDRRD